MATPLDQPIRVSRLAKSLGLTSLQVRNELRRFGIYAASPSTPITPVAVETYLAVRETLS